MYILFIFNIFNHYMNSCYSFKEYIYDDQIFTNVDATYIIHLEGNGRLQNIENQLEKYHPSKKTYILFNKGYKKCKKEEYINSPSKDLIDAFYTIFKDANSKNYNNILILEDDFIFDDKIKDKVNRQNIDDFLGDNSSETFVYYLGAITYLQSGMNDTNNRLYLSTGTHGCIYSKKCIDYFLDKVDQKSIADWDIFLNFGSIPRYKYYTPLCYQTFPDTDNSRSWHRDSTLLWILVFIQRSIFKLLYLDIECKFGFYTFEMISRVLFWLILFSIFYTIYKFIYVSL